MSVSDSSRLLPDRRMALGTGLASLAVAGLAGPAIARQPNNRQLAAFLADPPVRGDSSLKRRARADYHRSLERFGGRLSNSPEQLFHTSTLDPADQFDIVIIGSGYGAAMVASRLAPRLRTGRRLAILERGREWVPGDFADTFSDLVGQSRNQLLGGAERSVVNPLGLHNVLVNDEVNIWTANGLGGGSLINANIALLPDPDVFTHYPWPRELRDREVLHRYYQLAAAGLNLARTPPDQTPKVRVRRETADRLHPAPGFFDLPPMTVMYDDRWLNAESRNPQGMIQRTCTLCGDCITGCNVGAKNSLVMNYLPVAKSWGAEIYTQTEVRSIVPVDGGYRLELVYYDDRDCRITTRYTSICTRMVVLAAGSPGSAGLLLKSRDHGLCLSDALGSRWSGNADTLGFVVRRSGCNRIAGVGAHDKQEAVGPTVQTTLNYAHQPDLERRYVVQEAAIPSGMTRLFRILLQDASLTRTSVMLGMGHDGAGGWIQLDERGNVAVRWPGVKDAPFRKELWAEFERIAAAEGGEYKRLNITGDKLVSVHPLGGCPMSDDPACGVVNAWGEVFDPRGVPGPDGSAPVYPGLLVADGSVIPGSLGCNPLMTISALALRIADGVLANPRYAHLFG